VNIASLTLLLLATALSSPADAGRDYYGEAPSPNKVFTITFWSERAASNRDIREARLRRGQSEVWAFHFDGPQLYFNWSPSSRYLLAIGNTNPDYKLALYYLDVSADHPTERALNLDRVEKRSNAEIPLPHTDYLELKRVEWLSDSRCLLHFGYRPWRRDPRAVVFALNLADTKPAIKELTSTK
jgi:hypothetical protein